MRWPPRRGAWPSLLCAALRDAAEQGRAGSREEHVRLPARRRAHRDPLRHRRGADADAGRRPRRRSTRSPPRPASATPTARWSCAARAWTCSSSATASRPRSTDASRIVPHRSRPRHERRATAVRSGASASSAPARWAAASCKASSAPASRRRARHPRRSAGARRPPRRGALRVARASSRAPATSIVLLVVDADADRDACCSAPTARRGARAGAHRARLVDRRSRLRRGARARGSPTRGIALLDAPVSGGPAKAAAGTMTMMVSGDAGGVRAACAPVLERITGRLFALGPRPGDASAFKIVNNLLAARQPRGRRRGAGARAARAASICGRCSTSSTRAPARAGSSPTACRARSPATMRRARRRRSSTKDVGIAAALAERLGVDAPFTRAAHAAFARCRRRRLRRGRRRGAGAPRSKRAADRARA